MFVKSENAFLLFFSYFLRVLNVFVVLKGQEQTEAMSHFIPPILHFQLQKHLSVVMLGKYKK